MKVYNRAFIKGGIFMKKPRQDFKKIVDQLYDRKCVERLSQCTNLEEAKKVWKEIVSEYKEVCKNWKDKHYLTTESDWIYPRSKKLKVSDHPIEICVLVRLMNAEKDGRPIYNEVVVFEEDDLAARLRETATEAGIQLAEYVEEGEQICELTEEDFFDMFIS
jgi:hypothetical protein